MATGIEVRHEKSCRSLDGKRCSCDPTYRASVWSQADNKRIRRSFPSLAAAKAWRSDAHTAVRQGRLRAHAAPTLADAVSAWLDAAREGIVRTRGRRPFKPTTLRAVEQNYRLRLREPYGAVRLDRIAQVDLQEFIDKLDAGGLNASTIESTVLPLRLVYRHARTRGLVAVDPTEGLELPEKTSRGRRVPPSPEHAFKLLSAAPETDRALWATAMLAGLRRGELMALRWSDVDFKNGRLNVERSYDPTSGTYGTPKSRQGIRTVPLNATLAPYLREHLLRCGRRDGLVFGDARPFRGETVLARAGAAWEAAGLERVTLHACRHLFASVSIAAGVNAHALCKYMGHSSINVTYDLYGHLFPGNEAEASALLDAYLQRSFVATVVG